jgi:hypothetical protein
MASRSVEAEIDRLYQLAPDEFTAARNALAKTAGADAPEVRRLTKPPLAAWAVNQLYWKRRGLYDALIGASQELRQVHKAILAGRAPSREATAEAGRGDLRAAGKSHDEALESASKAALAILQEGGHPATDATRQAILTTLRALPAEEPAGRLTRALQPGGFEMLAGLSLGGGLKRNLRQTAEATKKADATKRAEVTQEKATQEAPGARRRSPTPGGTTAKAETPAEKRAREQVLSRAREAAAKAEREQRAAEHAAQREEFEAARSAREAEKAVKQLEQAREALAAAQQEFETAKASAATAARARDAAARRSKEAQRALEAARTRSQAALKAIP